MTQDEIIRMAREACAPNQTFNSDEEWVKRFAALVAAHEREKCFDAAMKAAEKAVDTAMLLEREACAKVCEQIDTNSMIQNWKSIDECVKECAAAIRSRSNEH